ncbi:MAG: hypothetical protein M3N04_07865 [Actinomycetota bacterium]|nr:hypothetical protein [Actinomycetota bacterium]
MISEMVLVLNAVLYVVALGLSLAVLTSLPEGASRRMRRARTTLACGGGLAMSVAITLSFMGHWFASAIVGCAAIFIVGASVWYALASRFSPRTDDEDEGEDGGGGPRKRPEPPAPPQPAGGPSDDLWRDFDRARAGWEREREPIVP